MPDSAPDSHRPDPHRPDLPAPDPGSPGFDTGGLDTGADAPVLVTRRGAVGVITLNRPAVMNALDAGLRAALTQAVVTLGPQARALVITGAGRAFCAGQDLAEPGVAPPADAHPNAGPNTGPDTGTNSGPASGPRIAAILAEEYTPLLGALTDCPVPVLAAVNGIAAGAGASLALACDMVIAAESARFVQAFARIGLMPDAGASWFLPRQVGLARAMGAALLAEDVPARQAADWGMIWDWAPDATFADRWQALADRLAAGPTRAHAALRQALRAGLSQGLAPQLALESQLQSALGATADFAEGLAAFRDRRAPAFRGM